MKFGFFTLGCKVNRVETQALLQLARERGHEIVAQNADAFIINTCTVTSVSDHKNLRAFHKIRRENPDAVIAACGCFAQMSPEKVQASGEIDLICGTNDRSAVLALCENAVQQRKQQQETAFPAVQISAPPAQFEALSGGVPEGRTRALLKVQDGCDNYCTYCIIPYARGHVRSMPLHTVLTQVSTLVQQGVHEIVITGIEISSYGRDLQQADLTLLLQQVCACAPQVRIRLSSLEPRTITADFCQRLAKFPNFMPHFHLSLQSGCDSVLARMKRHYTTAEFTQKLALLRQYFPHCSITTDLITGFPQETEAEFAQTLSFIEQCAFADMHVFPYSPRKGTIAAQLSGQLPPQVKQARAKAVKAVAASMAAQFLDSFLGQTVQVLLEHPLEDGTWVGHANWHFPILVQHAPAGKNQYVTVKLCKRQKDKLYGIVMP